MFGLFTRRRFLVGTLGLGTPGSWSSDFLQPCRVDVRGVSTTPHGYRDSLDQDRGLGLRDDSFVPRRFGQDRTTTDFLGGHHPAAWLRQGDVVFRGHTITGISSQGQSIEDFALGLALEVAQRH